MFQESKDLYVSTVVGHLGVHAMYTQVDGSVLKGQKGMIPCMQWWRQRPDEDKRNDFRDVHQFLRNLEHNDKSSKLIWDISGSPSQSPSRNAIKILFL